MFKKFVSSIAIIVLVGMMVVGGIAQADTNATVTATVTVQNVAMTLSQSSFAYGTMAANTASSTAGLFAGAGIVATNGSNVTADFDISGANTGTGKSGTGWDLKTAAGSDEYIHKFCDDTLNDCTIPAGQSNYIDLPVGPSTAVLKNNVAAAGTNAFQLQITTPNPSTKFTQQSVPVTVQVSAS
jgi:hypothetical protein